MLFQSFFFLWIFLPVMVIGWYFFSAFRSGSFADIFMIGMSIWFYALYGWSVLVLLLALTGAGYLFHRLLWMAKSAAQKNLILAVAVAAFLGVLLFCKWKTPAVPIGLSFYLFQLMAFLIERARGNLADVSIKEYLLYILYFPKLAQGPIALPAEMISQFRDRTRRVVSRERIVRGLMLFIFGLAKKVLLADALAPLVHEGFAKTLYLDTATVLLVLISYAFQLYFDFSGYCDMAMGISRMLGIELPVNFNAPFLAASLSDFWKRWHATLSRFFTRYVYIPLGGSRRGTLFTCLNILAVFVLSGFWHGLGLTYLLWGLINGVLVVISHLLSSGVRGEKKPERWTGRVRVFGFFLFTLVFFRSESVPMAFAMLERFLTPLYPGFLYRVAPQLEITELYPVMKALGIALPGMEAQISLILWILLLLVCFLLIRKGNAWEIAEKMPLSAKNAVGMGILYMFCMLAFNNVSSFLYFAY